MSSREDRRRFYDLRIDHSALGLAAWENPARRYFCTPEGADIFGGPGVDGVHYVLLPEDERVFCVDPTAGESGAYVLPVAKNFQEFLSFLLYCWDESPLAQLWRLDQAGFRQILWENTENPGCEALFHAKAVALAEVAAAFDLEPRDPFAAVKDLQKAFDPTVLHRSKEYSDTLGLENPKDV